MSFWTNKITYGIWAESYEAPLGWGVVQGPVGIFGQDEA